MALEQTESEKNVFSLRPHLEDVSFLYIDGVPENLIPIEAFQISGPTYIVVLKNAETEEPCFFTGTVDGIFTQMVVEEIRCIPLRASVFALVKGKMGDLPFVLHFDSDPKKMPQITLGNPYNDEQTAYEAIARYALARAVEDQ